MSDEVLTIREAAALLMLAKKTVYPMAQAQWIDAQPRGGDGGGRGE